MAPTEIDQLNKSAKQHNYDRLFLWEEQVGIAIPPYSLLESGKHSLMSLFERLSETEMVYMVLKKHRGDH